MKILIIDDHALFRDGLLLVLEGLNTGIETFEAGSYESAKDIMDEHNNLDLILLDLGLPGISHLDALLSIQQQTPDTPIVVLSGTEDQRMVEQALQQGARGYIPKSSSAKIILNALQLVIAGGTYVPAQILQKNSTNLSGQLINDVEINHNLTPRQNEVLQELAEGKSNKDIANALDLKESTVRAHVAAILKAFNVNNRTQAVKHATQKGFIMIQKNN